MDEFSSNQATDSHTLHLGSNSNQVAADDATQTQTQIRSQSAAGDGSQAEIITMDASLYKAAADGYIHALQQFPEVDLQTQLSPKENSVLHIAAQFGQLRCVKWMLEFPWCSSLLHRQNQKRGHSTSPCSKGRAFSGAESSHGCCKTASPGY